MKRSKISSILLDELLEEMKERKEIDNMKRKKELSFMMDDLLEKVDGVIDFIINEFDEVEQDEYMKEYLETLYFMNYVFKIIKK